MLIHKLDQYIKPFIFSSVIFGLLLLCANLDNSNAFNISVLWLISTTIALLFVYLDQKQRIKKRSLETASDTDAEQDSEREASSIGNKSLFLIALS